MIDFLVIGGGIAGTSVGALLSHLGHVQLLEEETALGYHASGRSAAMFLQRIVTGRFLPDAHLGHKTMKCAQSL